jgi:hypothetical protein
VETLERLGNDRDIGRPRFNDGGAPAAREEAGERGPGEQRS